MSVFRISRFGLKGDVARAAAGLHVGRLHVLRRAGDWAAGRGMRMSQFVDVLMTDGFMTSTGHRSRLLALACHFVVPFTLQTRMLCTVSHAQQPRHPQFWEQAWLCGLEWSAARLRPRNC